jgi:hypothetical protein
MQNIKIDSHAKILHKLFLKCNEIGAKLFILFPNYPTSEFNKNKNVIYDLKQQLMTKVNYIRLLNEPRSFVFDDSMFYDSVFHLNAFGREKRTKMLISILKSEIFLPSK